MGSRRNMQSLKSEASVSESLDSNDIDNNGYHYDHREIDDKENNDVPNFRPLSKSVPVRYQSKAPTLVALLDVVNERSKETAPKWKSETSRKLAAEEFKNLTSENDKLYKELSALKEKHDDLLHHKQSIDEQLASYKNKAENTTQIMDSIDILKSKCNKLEMEKTYLMEQLNESIVNGSNSQISQQQKPSINDVADNSQQIVMEYTVKMQREQNKINHILEEQKQKEKEYKNIVSTLSDQIKELKTDKNALSDNLEQQRIAMIKFK